MTTLQGWGGYPRVQARLLTPRSAQECARALATQAGIARGMGRSYGDSSLAKTVFQTRHLDHFIDWDPLTGRLTCEAGVTLRDMLSLVVPQGWFLPVTPGTSLVSLGGAIASDVHGKNHHAAGTFCQHVLGLTLLLGTGEIITTSPTQNPDLFHATCGGMGLTGLVLSASLQLQAIRSSNIRQTTIKSPCLEAVCEQFAAHAHSTYSVAWIDCLASGAQLGRSVLMLGEHAENGPLRVAAPGGLSVPLHTPAALLNRWTMQAFNSLYYASARHQTTHTLPFEPFFYPLDKIDHWNRLYGRPGFVQFQFVLPHTDGVSNMRTVLTRIAASGMGSFLAVLKQFGPHNQNLLSFPMAGYSLALDFKLNPQTRALVQALEPMVAGMGGRIYLTKDALMTEQTFKQTYPHWQAFEAVRQKYGAIGQWTSLQSQRLGLQ